MSRIVRCEFPGFLRGIARHSRMSKAVASPADNRVTVGINAGHVALAALMLAAADVGSAQSVGARLTVRVVSDSLPISDALVAAKGGRVLTGVSGIAVLLLPAGSARVVARKLGFLPDTAEIVMPLSRDTSITMHLTARSLELPPVLVASTRTNRRVEDEPTRVEVLGGEEVGEKVSMSPGNVSMLLNETSGVRVVATAPALGGANIRIQGLRGRYTQLLSDGLPLYGLSTDGLGILQIPPLDLQRVEIIKGAASALYGPSALGGVVNFISRRPDDSSDLLINQTSLDATDLVAYDGRQVTPRIGYTFLAGLHRQRPQDFDRDGWSDLAGYERVVLRPRLFISAARGSSVFITAGFTRENRDGGSIGAALLPDGSSFPQGQSTMRADAGSTLQLPIDSSSVLSVRASISRQSRAQTFGAANERDERSTTFAEMSYARTVAQHVFLIGSAFQGDRFSEPGTPSLSYASNTPALFAQHTWSPMSAFGMTTSARLDHHSIFGTYLSPRISLLTRPTIGAKARLTLRVSAGTGVFTPTPFAEETEEISFTRLRPLAGLRAEHARNVSIDFGGQFGALEVSVSGYAAVIDRAVTLRAVPSTSPIPDVELVNGQQPTRNAGLEVFARYRIDEFRITGTYARLRSTEWDADQLLRRDVPLTPTNSGGLVLSWESENGARVGLEGYFVGRQSLNDNPYRSRSNAYTLLGALAQLRVKRALVFVNAENLLDVRQTKTNSLLLPRRGAGGRWTTDVWAPVDGRVINAGLRFDRFRSER